MRAVALAVFCAAMLPVAAVAWPTLAVINVPQGDVLNLRSAPDAKAPKVASLPRNASGISADAVAVKGIDWIHIQKDGKSGWVNAKFLAYESGQRLPVRMTCVGTEPFWAIAVGYGRADADLNFNQTKQTLALDAPMVANGRPDLWHLPTTRGSNFLTIQKQVCSDGMSDRLYPYSVTARVGANLLSGCCR